MFSILKSTYKLNVKYMINIYKFSTTTTTLIKGKTSKMQPEDKKKKIALISAQLNFGQGKYTFLATFPSKNAQHN